MSRVVGAIETYHHMPLDVAVEQPCARIVRDVPIYSPVSLHFRLQLRYSKDEPNNEPAGFWQVDCVPIGRSLEVDHRRRGSGHGRVREFPAPGAQDPEFVAVEMDRVGHLERCQRSGWRRFALVALRRAYLVHGIVGDRHDDIEC